MKIDNIHCVTVDMKNQEKMEYFSVFDVENFLRPTKMS